MTREDMVSHLWSKVEEKLYITKEQFVTTLENWNVFEIGGGSHIGMTKGPEFHIDGVIDSATLPLSEISKVLSDLVDRHGFASTRTPKEDLRQRRFNERFGAVATGEDEYDVHYQFKSRRIACR